jgi:hypothetical protein
MTGSVSVKTECISSQSYSFCFFSPSHGLAKRLTKLNTTASSQIFFSKDFLPQPEQIILSARVGRKIQDVTLSLSPRDSKTE